MLIRKWRESICKIEAKNVSYQGIATCSYKVVKDNPMLSSGQSAPIKEQNPTCTSNQHSLMQTS